MQVSVEFPSKLERRLTIVVPVEKLNEAYDKKLTRLTKTAKVNGFRPGKIPLQVIKQHYGAAAKQEALSEVIEDSLYTAITQEKLNPVGTPNVEPTKIAPDEPLEFIATFEVLPEIEMVHFNVETLEKEVATITDADIEKVLGYLREQNTTWSEVNRPAQEKDQVIIDFKGSVDGVPFAGGQAHDYPIVLGSKVMVPGFEDGIIGMSPGEEKTIQVKFPESYFAKEVAGKDTEFAIKLIEVLQPDSFEFNAEMVKKLGVKSGELADLRVEVRKNLERELERVIKLKLKNNVFNKLLEQNPLEIPKALIEREAARIHDEMHPNHDHHHHAHTPEEMASFDQAAVRNVALGLLVAEIVKKQKITVDKERIKAHMISMSNAYENPDEVLKWYENNKRAYAEIEMQVLEDQVVETLLKNVNVIEKMLSYSELIA